jgi:hypothetical protein
MTGTIAGFTSTGIDDNATSTAITIDSSENVQLSTGNKRLYATSNAGNKASLVVFNQTAATNSMFIGGGTSLGEPATDISFYTGSAGATGAGSGRMSIDSAGNVTVSTGNLVIGTSGKGIDFSADGNAAGMTSEVLDDYEEGTWTPGITFGGTFDGTYDGQVGNYTKIGDLVTVSCFVDLGTKGTTTGAALLTGLPFTTNTTALTYSAPSFYINTVSFADMIVGFATNNGTTVIIREVTNAGSASNLDNTNFTDTSHVIMNLSYRV